MKELVDYARTAKRKLIVTGYADSRTGTAERNEALGRERAEVVAAELVKMGMPRENIVVRTGGGVDSLAPFSYNRRVTVRVE